ncbi:MAG: amidohydrolase family protein [Gammaproteobacteria bacterium]|nr:amidohydrolase family protein [Gammaproteobacteria bacterium]
MPYDILIQNGTVIDGSGGERSLANVAITDGYITEIGDVNGLAKQTIDAEGHVVAPGFVDGHTHMDAQVFWDNLGSCSCYHGVTSVVMGNCGFTLAPCKESDADHVFRNLERAGDISRSAMLEGIDWSWESYPDYLDAVDATPKGINYAGYVGHSALRTYVMGDRAFTDVASVEETKRMGELVQEAVQAGAIGLSTSRSRNHQTSDHKPVSSRIASWEEVKYLVQNMRSTGAGMFEIAAEDIGRDPEKLLDYQSRIKELAVDCGCPVTWGMFSSRHIPDRWRSFFKLLDEVEEAGGNMFAQVHSRALNVIYTFESNTPFDGWNVWREVRRLPLEEQKAKLRDPEVKAKLVEAASHESERHKERSVIVRPPNWHWVFAMDEPSGGSKRMDELAAERGISPVELMIDMALESDFKCMFRQPIANENQDDVIEMMKHPKSAVTFSDSGAHVSQIMDSSLQTHIFSHWVREREELTLEQAVAMVTSETASRWGLRDRGLLMPGYAADVVVFDPDSIGPDMPTVERDLPSGAKRLKQTAQGIKSTIVNGEVFLNSNVHTGAQSGKLLRGPLAQNGSS